MYLTVFWKTRHINQLILKDFNARNSLWNKYIDQNKKISIALEELIQRHGLYAATDLDYTYQHSPNCRNSGKSTIDLTLSCGINNLTVKAREINKIKTRHKASETDIENLSDKNRSHTPHFRTELANWDE